MTKKCLVDLNEEELKLLNELLASGTQRVRDLAGSKKTLYLVAHLGRL